MDVWAQANMARPVDEARDGLLALTVLNIADAGVSRDDTDAVAVPISRNWRG
jgi:hypothetical protein